MVSKGCGSTRRKSDWLSAFCTLSKQFLLWLLFLLELAGGRCVSCQCGPAGLLITFLTWCWVKQNKNVELSDLWVTPALLQGLLERLEYTNSAKTWRLPVILCQHPAELPALISCYRPPVGVGGDFQEYLSGVIMSHAQHSFSRIKSASAQRNQHVEWWADEADLHLAHWKPFLET